MATDLIRYDVLVQQALRSVVRKVLADGVKDGLPGAHHFYISFDTHAPGVKITPRLREMYPEEMTIVLQHQYWDLSVSETHFEVSLSFDKIAEHLVVPFEAITGFFDPSVKFGLKFEAVTAEPAEADGPARGRKPRTRSDNGEPVPLGRKPKLKDVSAVAPALPQLPGPGASGPASLPAPALDGASRQDDVQGAGKISETAAENTADKAGEKPDEPGTAEVVSLDAFRKKK